jgi:phosphoribosylformylglycinamidine synthase
MIEALRDDLGQEVISLWHKDNDLTMFNTEDCIVLPGGFSYGDYLRCGAIARFSPMMQEVVKFANKGGRVLGVCNGFQILCESGLLPGALLRNAGQQFVCKNVFIKSNKEGLPPLKIPVAHGEGRYHAPENELKRMEETGRILFRYCDENGIVAPSANPNGAMLNIAGICNESGNVVGMMPHPERAVSESLKNTDGRFVFNSLYGIPSLN